MKKRLFYSAVFSLSCMIIAALFYHYRTDFDPKNLLVLKSTKIMNIIDPQNVQININGPCGLTQIDEHHVIFVNYNQMYDLDTRTGETVLLSKPKDVEIWRPTGVKWCQANQQLYIANYTGEDVLVLRLVNNNELEFVRRYTHPFMVGPENITVDKDGKSFAVADYDAQKVLFFNNEGLLWSQEIGRAHGVAFSADQKSILVTGLSPARIYQFDLSGRLLRQAGKVGWVKNGYLWPTSIVVNSGQTWVSDAHTGKISLLDGKLKTIRTIGGNGLGLDLFNMPYGVEFTNNQLLYIADTFKGRILKIDPVTSEVLAIYQGQESIVDTSSFGYKLSIKSVATSTGEKPQGLTYKARTNIAGPINIDFKYAAIPRIWQCGYNYFIAQSDRHFNLSGVTPFVSSSYFYWINAKNHQYKNANFTIIGSPQAWTWLILYKGIMYPIAVGADFYVKDNCIISSYGKSISLDSLCEIASSKIEDYIQAVSKGKLPLKAIAEHLFSTDDFENKFASAFTSAKGKILLKELTASQNLQQYQHAAEKYLTDVKDDRILYFFEIAIANIVLESINSNKEEKVIQ